MALYSHRMRRPVSPRLKRTQAPYRKSSTEPWVVSVLKQKSGLSANLRSPKGTAMRCTVASGLVQPQGQHATDSGRALGYRKHCMSLRKSVGNVPVPSSTSAFWLHPPPFNSNGQENSSDAVARQHSDRMRLLPLFYRGLTVSNIGQTTNCVRQKSTSGVPVLHQAMICGADLMPPSHPADIDLISRFRERP
jgi:hypothetical protein